jgi:energy-converting hydrogenase A subunit M
MSKENRREEEKVSSPPRAGDDLVEINIKTDQDNLDEETTIPEENEEFAAEMEKEFRREIAVDKEEEAATDEELYLRMKRRIIRSFKWQEDIIIPFSEELNITPEELEEILINRLDMSSLEALHPRFESSKYRCTKERTHSDLKLCWLLDVMNLLTLEEAEEIKNRMTLKIVTKNEPYEKALKEGRKELVEYLKGNPKIKSLKP